MTGFVTLLHKELLRFWKVGFQTVFAPILSSLLYLLIFSHALSEHAHAYPGVTYTVFLIPGLVIMAMLQNAFANSSSSLIQSKVSGNHVFMLLSPLSYQEIFTAYVLASVVRGLLVGLGIYVVTLGVFEVPLYSFPWVFVFAVMGTALLGALGVIAGIWAEKFEQLAALQNFIILPLTFLSGVFYTTRSLPPFWQELSHLNPFFYVIDGFRYGFFRTSDIPLSKPRDSGGVFPGDIVGDTADAEERLQNPPMTCLSDSGRVIRLCQPSKIPATGAILDSMAITRVTCILQCIRISFITG